MTPKPWISVLVPTRGRVDLLDKMLRSLVKTAEKPDLVEVVFRVDYDDAETIGYLNAQQPWLSVLNGTPCVLGPHLNGYATLPIMINEAARLSTSDLLIVINDDVEFKTKGWDRRLNEEAAKFPDGIFNIGVDTVNNNPNFVFPCQSRRQVELFGFFYDPRLIYTDIWLRDALGPLGKLHRVPDVVIEHQWAGMSTEQRQAVHTVRTRDYQELYERCVNEAKQKAQAALWT